MDHLCRGGCLGGVLAWRQQSLQSACGLGSRDSITARSLRRALRGLLDVLVDLGHAGSAKPTRAASAIPMRGVPGRSCLPSGFPRRPTALRPVGAAPVGPSATPRFPLWFLPPDAAPRAVWRVSDAQGCLFSFPRCATADLAESIRGWPALPVQERLRDGTRSLFRPGGREYPSETGRAAWQRRLRQGRVAHRPRHPVGRGALVPNVLVLEIRAFQGASSEITALGGGGGQPATCTPLRSTRQADLCARPHCLRAQSCAAGPPCWDRRRSLS